MVLKNIFNEVYQLLLQSCIDDPTTCCSAESGTDFVAARRANNRWWDDPYKNAELILWEALDLKNRSQIYLSRDLEISEEKTAKIFEAARQRLEQKPLQYIFGRSEFFSLPFEVTENCLIPRPETELLVSQAIEWLEREKKSSPKILDIGTGSGNIPVTIAKHIPDAKILSIDISEKALSLARRNIGRHNLSSQISVIASDLFQSLKTEPSFDMIISNPPYIDEKDWEDLPQEVRAFEPRSALWGGKEGLQIILKIIDRAHFFLRPGGVLLMEFGTSKQITGIKKALDKTQSFTAIEFLKDDALKDRMVKALRTPIPI